MMSKLKARDWNAVAAHFRNSAGAMKDRRVSRGGDTNTSRDLLDDYFECDFCGVTANSVYRTVTDTGYDRTTSKALYACKKCSIEKDKERNDNELS